MYKISKGQLWVIIFGAIILWAFFFVNAISWSADWWGGLGSVAVPFLLVFYIIGWKNYQKKNDFESKLFGSSLSKIFSFGKKIIIPVIIISLGAAGLAWYVDSQKDGGRIDGLENVRQAQIDEYVGRFNRFEQHRQNALSCVEEVVEENFDTYTAQCQENYDTEYAEYQNCRNRYGLSHVECIRYNDYEEIDCSEETIRQKIEDENRSCYSTVATEFNYLVNFEEDLIDDYLSNLPANQSSLNQEEVQELYSKIPSEVFNDKTEERFNEYVKEQGYFIN